MDKLILALRLYFEFFKTGLFSVGGGMATLPFLSEMSDRTGWFTHAELANMIAVAESTPGPIGVNTATYVGYTTLGLPGGIISTLGLITPSIIIILIIASVLEKFRESYLIKSIFYFLRPTSCALILSAVISLAKMAFFMDGYVDMSHISIEAILLAIIILLLTNFVKITKKIHPIVWILFSAGVGIIFF